MTDLWDPDRHEPLAGAAWNAGAVRAAIERIVVDARATFTPDGLWPIHPDDGPPEHGPFAGLYFGAAGVIWALDHLQGAGAVPEGPTFSERLPEIEVRDAGFLERLGPMAGGYLLGRGGLLFVRWKTGRDGETLARLADLIAANSENRALELMWGAPGTMLVALALHEATGEARWADLFRAGAAALEAAFVPDETLDARIWTQDLYGSHVAFLGAVHGFAGNAAVLNAGRLLAPDKTWDAWREEIGRTLRATAIREGDLANWAPQLGLPTEGRHGRLLLQHCHGAPGMVTALAGIDAPIDDLLIAGGETTWRGGPLRKGSNLCHGTAGNGYAFLKLFERTGDEMWLERARAFAMHAIAQSEAQAAELGRRRHSLWTGDPGLACYLWDCLEGRARFPTVDVL
jgi:hypothetical protein